MASHRAEHRPSVETTTQQREIAVRRGAIILAVTALVAWGIDEIPGVHYLPAPNPAHAPQQPGQH